MKRVLVTIAIILIALLLVGCYQRGEKVRATGENWDSDVRKLFEVDGISVYRFKDGLNTVYFTSTTGKATCIRRDDDNTEVTECICNGKVKTKNSEDQNNRTKE